MTGLRQGNAQIVLRSDQTGIHTYGLLRVLDRLFEMFLAVAN